MFSIHRFVRGLISPLAVLFLALIAMPGVYAVSADELSKQAQEKVEREDYAGALADLDRAISAAPDEARYFFYRAFAKDGLNDAAGAMADVNKALRLNVEQADAYELRARLKAQAGDREGGIADYDAAIKLRPLGLFRLQINRGVLLYQTGRHAEVIAAMDDVLGETTFPDYVSAGHMLRGMARAGLHDYTAAVADYTKVLESTYVHPENAYFERAKARFHLLDFEGARADIKESLNRLKAPEDPENYSEWFLFGCLMIDQGGPESAEAFARAYAMNPDHCRAALIIRHMRLVQERETDDELLAQAVKTWKNDPWRQRLAAFALGEISEEDLAKGLDASDNRPEGATKRCELFFYAFLGAKDGDEETEKRTLREALATNQVGSPEFTLARYFAKKLLEP
jgi:tetratricopeptide (TPR) repeat protein